MNILLIGTFVITKSQSFVVLKKIVCNHTSCVEKINGRYLLTITIVISSQDNETIFHQWKEKHSIDNQGHDTKEVICVLDPTSKGAGKHIER